jgi:hypothetical protein
MYAKFSSISGTIVLCVGHKATKPPNNIRYHIRIVQLLKLVIAAAVLSTPEPQKPHTCDLSYILVQPDRR